MGHITIHPDDLRESDSIVSVGYKLDSEDFDSRDVLVFLQSAEQFLSNLYVHVMRGRSSLDVNARVGYGGSREFLTHDEKRRMDEEVESANHYWTTIVRRDIYLRLEIDSITIERDEDDDVDLTLPSPSSPLTADREVNLAV